MQQLKEHLLVIEEVVEGDQVKPNLVSTKLVAIKNNNDRKVNVDPKVGVDNINEKRVRLRRESTDNSNIHPFLLHQNESQNTSSFSFEKSINYMRTRHSVKLVKMHCVA